MNDEHKSDSFTNTDPVPIIQFQVYSI